MENVDCPVPRRVQDKRRHSAIAPLLAMTKAFFGTKYLNITSELKMKYEL